MAQIAGPKRNATPAERQAIADLLEKAAEHDLTDTLKGCAANEALSVLAAVRQAAYKQALAPTTPTWSADQQRRAAALEGMKGTAAGALLSLAEVGTAAIQRMGNATRVDWVAAEREAATQSLKDHRQPVDEVVQAIIQASPNAVTERQGEGIHQRLETLAKTVVVVPSEPGQQSAPSLES